MCNSFVHYSVILILFPIWQQFDVNILYVSRSFFPYLFSSFECCSHVMASRKHVVLIKHLAISNKDCLSIQVVTLVY